MEFRNHPINSLRKDFNPTNVAMAQHVLRGWTSGVHAKHISDPEIIIARQKNILSPNYSRNKGI